MSLEIHLPSGSYNAFCNSEGVFVVADGPHKGVIVPVPSLLKQPLPRVCPKCEGLAFSEYKFRFWKLSLCFKISCALCKGVGDWYQVTVS